MPRRREKGAALYYENTATKHECLANVYAERSNSNLKSVVVVLDLKQPRLLSRTTYNYVVRAFDPSDRNPCVFGAVHLWRANKRVKHMDCVSGFLYCPVRQRLNDWSPWVSQWSPRLVRRKV